MCSTLFTVRAFSLGQLWHVSSVCCLSCRPAELAPGAEAQFSTLQQDYQLLLLARLDLQRRGLGWQLEGQRGGDADEEGAASG